MLISKLKSKSLIAILLIAFNLFVVTERDRAWSGYCEKPDGFNVVPNYQKVNYE